jgi:hypothetical protein
MREWSENIRSKETMSLQENAAIELLLTLRIQVRRVCHIVGTPAGDRAVFDIVGGSFEGESLRGRVLASGGDWVTRNPAGSQLDVRLVLQTDDGVTIPYRYGGRVSEREGKPRVEVAGIFEAPQGAYAWLNGVQAFGLGMGTSDSVEYNLFRFK